VTVGPCSSRNISRDGWRRVLTILCHYRVSKRLDNRVIGSRVRRVLLLCLLVLLVVLDSFNAADKSVLESFKGDKILFEGL